MCDSLPRPQDVGQRWSGGRDKAIQRTCGGGFWRQSTAAWAARAAASVFRVNKALIRRRRTGEVSASSRRGHRPRKLTPAQETALAGHIAAHPDITLAALQTWLAGEHAVRLSNGAMWSAVDRLGLMA
jgi:transposase